MILITLAGDSSRFFRAGFSVVKYKLRLGDMSILEHILSYVPCHEKVLIVLNKKFNDLEFVANLLERMSFETFKVVEIDRTRGQFESAILGLEKAADFCLDTEPLVVYNGDTVRMLDFWNYDNCDGYIEVFESEGSHWSFVDRIGFVNRVTEKERISPYCSSGLYFFKRIKYIKEISKDYVSSEFGETYIAPAYNILISQGMKIVSGLVDKSSFTFCGTPEEYSEARLYYEL